MNKITKQEMILAILFAAIGLILTTKSFLTFDSGLTPIQGLIVYYIILFSLIIIMTKVGLSVAHIEIKQASQTIGLILIMISFFIVTNSENQYIQYATMGTYDGASPLFYHTEDAVVYYFYNTTLGVQSIALLRILTFVITPFILTLLGGYLVTKPKLNLL